MKDGMPLPPGLRKSPKQGGIFPNESILSGQSRLEMSMAKRSMDLSEKQMKLSNDDINKYQKQLDDFVAKPIPFLKSEDTPTDAEAKLALLLSNGDDGKPRSEEATMIQKNLTKAKLDYGLHKVDFATARSLYGRLQQEASKLWQGKGSPPLVELHRP